MRKKEKQPLIFADTILADNLQSKVTFVLKGGVPLWYHFKARVQCGGFREFDIRSTYKGWAAHDWSAMAGTQQALGVVAIAIAGLRHDELN